MKSEQEVSTEVSAALAKLGSFAILNQEQRVSVSASVKIAKATIKEAQEYFEPMKSKAYATWKEVCAKENEIVKPLEAGILAANNRMSAWDKAERERLAKIDRERQAEALRRQDEERLALALEKEREAERLRGLAAGAEPDAAANLRADAEEIAEQADAILATPIAAPVIVAAPVAKIAGETSRGTWTAEVTDISALIRAVAADPRLERLLTFVPKQLNDLARERQGENPPAGVKFEKKTTYAH